MSDAASQVWFATFMSGFSLGLGTMAVILILAKQFADKGRFW